MGYKNTRRRQAEPSKNIALPLLFGLTLLWLLVASIEDKSPTALLSDVYTWAIGAESDYPNTAELQARIDAQGATVDSLSDTIEELINKSPYRTAIVNTTADELNLRSQPNLSSSIVIKIPDSSAVKILYYDEEVLVLDGETGKWCKIKYADQEGWVWGNYLQVD